MGNWTRVGRSMLRAAKDGFGGGGAAMKDTLGTLAERSTKYVEFQGKKHILETLPQDLSKLDTCGLSVRPKPNVDAIELGNVTNVADDVERNIQELKSQILKMGNESYTYDEYKRICAEDMINNEDVLLEQWYRYLQNSVIRTRPKNQINCRNFIKEFLAEGNIRKSDIFKSMSTEEIDAIRNCGDGTEQLLACLSGHKPAFFDCNMPVDSLMKSIKNSKLAESYTVIKPINLNANHICILNNKQVKDIISQNREIFCRELKLDLKTPDETIFERLLSSIEKEFPSRDNPLMFGLTLGYPKYSSILYTMEMSEVGQSIMGRNLGFLAGSSRHRDVMLAMLHDENSILKNYSKEFIDDVERYIKTEDFRPYAHPFKERFISSFRLYGSDARDMQRIRQNETDFVNKFTPEWFLQQTNW